MEIPSTPIRSAIEYEGISPKLNVSWNPLLLEFSAPTRTIERIKEIPDITSEYLYLNSVVQEFPTKRTIKVNRGNTRTVKRISEW